MADRETDVSALAGELDVTRQTLYRHVGPGGELRADGQKLMGKRARGEHSPCPTSRFRSAASSS